MSDQKQANKVQAEWAFWEIYKKISTKAENNEFFEFVIRELSPFDYIDSHYNLFKDFMAFKPDSKAEVVFNHNWDVPLRSIDETDVQYWVYFGDVVVKGNMELHMDQRVYIVGNLHVDGAIVLSAYTSLMVGGEIKASGLYVDGGCTELLVDNIEIVDVVALRNISKKNTTSDNIFYCTKLSCRLFISTIDEISITFNARVLNEVKERSLLLNVYAEYRCLEDNFDKIKSLFHPLLQEQFTDVSSSLDEIFEVIKGTSLLYDDNYLPVTLWAEG